MQCSHIQESVGKNSSIFENENLSLNQDNLETRFIDHHEEKQSPFSMFIFDEFSSEPDFPKYDKYGDSFDEDLDEII